MSIRYIDEFLSLKCAPHLLKLGYFPNSKEVTESMAMYNAYRTYFFKQIKHDDENVLCIVVGDGKYPRTGALFAMRTKWTIVSIDPTSVYDYHDGVKRLTTFKEKLEKISKDDFYKIRDYKSKIVIIYPHSHAKLEDSEFLVKYVGGKLPHKEYLTIVMPCCFKQDIFLDQYPNFEYRDDAVNSEKNLIKIFTNIEKGE